MYSILCFFKLVVQGLREIGVFSQESGQQDLVVYVYSLSLRSTSGILTLNFAISARQT